MVADIIEAITLPTDPLPALQPWPEVAGCQIAPAAVCAGRLGDTGPLLPMPEPAGTRPAAPYAARNRAKGDITKPKRQDNANVPPFGNRNNHEPAGWPILPRLAASIGAGVMLQWQVTAEVNNI